MELTQKIKWNKLTTRELDEDEKELSRKTRVLHL